MNSYKKYISLPVIGLLALIMFVGITRSGQSGATPTKQEKVKQLQATATEKQKKHSKLLKQSQGRKLRDLAAQGTGDILITVEEPFIIRTPDKETPRARFPQDAVCKAEAVVVGTLDDDSPQMTEDESFLFTEYAMSVTEVIKDNAIAPIPQGSNITVVRDGGTGQLDGRIIRARVEGFKSFTVGKRYLLFLRYIPETGSYLAYANGSFELNANEVIPSGRMPESESRDAMAFLSAIRAATAANDCINQRETSR